MNSQNVSGTESYSREEMMSALFGHMVVQQSNMALMLMGNMPHPQSGQTVRDLDAAKLFIDQLEMLEAKTKGNLSKEEEKLLKQSLMNLRLAFVEAVEKAPEEPKPADPTKAPGKAGGSEPSQAAPSEESHKKFSKKY